MAAAPAVVAALVNKGQARLVLATAVISAPHLLDVEVMSVFRRLSRAGALAEGQVESCLTAFQAQWPSALAGENLAAASQPQRLRRQLCVPG